MNLIPSNDLFVGDLWSWSHELVEFPTDTYSLRYIFRNTVDATKHLTIDSTPAGQFVHQVSASGTNTAALLAGDYMVFVQLVTLASSQVQTLQQGKVKLLPNPSDTSIAPSDTRSKWALYIEQIEAALAGDVQAGTAEYNIGGRMKKLQTTKDRLEFLAYCKRQLAKEQGFPFGRLIKYTFVD